MNISNLLFSQNPLGGSVGINTTVKIDTPYDLNSRKVYRQVYYLHFSVDPSSEGIVVDDAASVLQGYFNDYQLNLTENDTCFQTIAWQAIKEADNTATNLVKVHLAHPWRLHSVSTIDTRGVEVLRLDGDSVSSQPTVSGNANRVFSNEFIGQDFALRKVAVFPIREIQEKVDKKTLSRVVNEIAVDMGKVVGEVKNGSKIISSHGINSINLRSVPTGPRILLGEIGQTPSLEDNLLSIWQQPGEQPETPVYFFTENIDWQTALLQIQKSCDRYFTALKESSVSPSANLYLPIIFESDTPVRLYLTELGVEYGLVRSHLDKVAPKHTISFSGTAVDTEQLQLSLPTNCNIKKAKIKIHNSLKNNLNFVDPNVLIESPSFHSGMTLFEGTSIANRFLNTAPQLIDSIVIAVLPQAEEVRATLQIVKDINNAPNGPVLAESQIKLSQSYTKQWSIANFSNPILLDTGYSWLRLRMRQGCLVWLGEENSEGAVHINQPDKVESKINAMILQNHVGFVGASGSEELGLTIQVGHSQAVFEEKEGSVLTFDIVEALNSHCGSGAPPPVAIKFSSGSQGNITIKGLDIIYEI